MKLFVLGATGGTGNELVEAALRRGHQVTAFVRSPMKLEPRDGLVIVREIREAPTSSPPSCWATTP